MKHVLNFWPLLIVLASGCATASNVENIGPESPIVIPPGQGVVAVRFISNYDGNVKEYKNPISMMFQHQKQFLMYSGMSMRSNDDAQFRVLEPGRYRIEQLLVNGGVYLDLDTKQSTFEVMPDKITYIGDIVLMLGSEKIPRGLSSYIPIERLDVRNNVDQIVARLLSEHPEVDGTMDVATSLAKIVPKD